MSLQFDSIDGWGFFWVSCDFDATVTRMVHGLIHASGFTLCALDFSIQTLRIARTGYIMGMKIMKDLFFSICVRRKGVMRSALEDLEATSPSGGSLGYLLKILAIMKSI